MLGALQHPRCLACGAEVPVRSFWLMPNRCPGCGCRHGIAQRFSRHAVVGVAASIGVMATSMLVGFGVAYVSVAILRSITGQPNGWKELGVWTWKLSVSAIYGGLALVFSRWLGYRPVGHQTDDERRAARRWLWKRAIGKSGAFLGLFLAWPQPDFASKVIAVMTWIAWLALIARPLIRRAAMLTWR